MFLFDNANIIIMMEKGNFIVDTNKYSLGLDIDGKENTTEDLHPLLLKIVLELDRICRKYNIPYALSYGSALGLYNYGGFIPWDDDMDIDKYSIAVMTSIRQCVIISLFYIRIFIANLKSGD